MNAVGLPRANGPRIADAMTAAERSVLGRVRIHSQEIGTLIMQAVRPGADVLAAQSHLNRAHRFASEIVNLLDERGGFSPAAVEYMRKLADELKAAAVKLNDSKLPGAVSQEATSSVARASLAVSWAARSEREKVIARALSAGRTAEFGARSFDQDLRATEELAKLTGPAKEAVAQLEPLLAGAPVKGHWDWSRERDEYLTSNFYVAPLGTQKPGTEDTCSAPTMAEHFLLLMERAKQPGALLCTEHATFRWEKDKFVPHGKP